MNQLIQGWGVGLAKKLIDVGVARLSGPPRTTPEQRIGQIDKMLETLESEPEVVQHLARPPAEASEASKEASPAPAATSTTEDVATACLACAVGHFSTSAGLLNECVRFKKDGILSNEIIDRVAKVLEEQNTLERVDLTPEKIQDSPEWERAIAEEALQQSRSLRHRLETIETIEEIEQAAADTSAYYRKLNREWWKQRFSHIGGRAEAEETEDDTRS